MENEWTKRIKELEDEVAKLIADRDADRKREYGYSQQTIDTLTAERDKLTAERSDWKARYQSVSEMHDALIKEYNEVRAENKRLAGELAKWTRKHDDADLQGMKKQADQPSLAAKQAYINALVYYLRHAEDENKRLRELVDGARVIVEVFQWSTPAQERWREEWLKKAAKALKEASHET